MAVPSSVELLWEAEVAAAQAKCPKMAEGVLDSTLFVSTLFASTLSVLGAQGSLLPAAA